MKSKKRKSFTNNNVYLYLSLSLSLSYRLEETEDKYHNALAELNDKSTFLSDLEKERDRNMAESSSRLANLNQTLLHTKHMLSQSEAQVEELKEQEKMLLQENETLEKRCVQLALKLEEPCKLCSSISQQMFSKKEDEVSRSVSTPVTPHKPLPEQSEISRLLDENSKLKQKYDCLFANYQMVSEKSSQLKKDIKESEKSLYNLQGICDTLKAEKEDIQSNYKKIQQALQTYQDKENSTKKKHGQLRNESENLLKELTEIQEKHDELLKKNDNLQTQLQTTQDTVSNLRSQISSLKIEKTENQRALEDTRFRLDELMEELKNCRDSSSNSSQNSSYQLDLLTNCKEKLAEVKKERDELQQKVEEMCNALSVMEDEKCGLVSSNSKLQDTIHCLESQQLKSSEMRQASLSAAEEIVNLQTKLTNASEENQDFIRESVNLKAKIKETQSRITELKKLVSKHQQDSKCKDETVSKMQKTLESIECKRSSTEQELTKKSNELIVVTKQARQLKQDLKMTLQANSSLDTELMQCRMRLDELETMNFELESCLMEKSSNESIISLKKHDVEKKLHEMETKLSATQKVLYEKESILNDLTISRELLEKENSNLLSQLDQVSHSLMIANAENDNLHKQLSSYDYKTKEISFQITELETAHGSCRLVKEKLEMELDIAKDQMIGLQDELAIKKAELSSAKLDMKQAKLARENLEEVVREYETKLTFKTDKNDELSLRIERQEQQLLELTEHSKTKSESLRVAEKEMARLKNENQEIQVNYLSKLEKSEEKYYELKELYDSLHSEKREASLQISQMKVTLEELQRSNDQVLSERAELLNKIDRLKDEKASLSKELETLKFKWKEAKRDIRYQRKKISEKEKSYKYQYAQAISEFKSLREEALSVLSEPSTPSKNGRHKKTRSASSEDDIKILRPLENLKPQL